MGSLLRNSKYVTFLFWGKVDSKTIPSLEFRGL